MCSTARPRFFVEGDIGDAECLGCREIILAGTAAVGTDLPGRHAEIGDLPLEMGPTPVLCGNAGNGKVAPIAAIREMPRNAIRRISMRTGHLRERPHGAAAGANPSKNRTDGHAPFDRAGAAGAAGGRYQPAIGDYPASKD